MNRIALLVVLIFLNACNDPPADLEQDTMPPLVIVSADPAGDENGDGLVDVRVSWSWGERVDPARTVIRALDAESTPERNYFQLWRHVVSDTGIVVHEPLEHMLPFGPVRLEIQVTDSSGNVTSDTLQLDLPAGKLIKTLTTARTETTHRAFNIAICDGMGYMPAGPFMIVFDPDSLRVLADVRNPDTLLNLNDLVCADDGIIYVTDRVHRFDRETRSWLPYLYGTYGANAIALSRSTPGLLFIGEVGGGVATFDRLTQKRTGNFESWSSFRDDLVATIAVLPADKKLYFTRVYEGGILILEPASGKLLGKIQLGGQSPYVVDDMVLSAEGDLLYAAVYDGNPRGVAIVNTVTDGIVRMIPLPEYLPAGIAVSPSGKRLFVTTQDRDPEFPSDNLLIDLTTGTVIQRFQRPRVGRRFDAGVVFHPHGKYVFVVRNLEIDVYLNRE